jgi:hypothetical protein
MNDVTLELAAVAGRLLGMDAQFEQVLEALLASLRRLMGVSDVTDPLVDEEFSRARIRLQLFRDEYRALYARAIASQIAADELPGVLEGLSHPGVRRFRSAEAQINREIAQATAVLSNRMADTLMFEPPTSAVGDEG